jgi:hypothetical protein
MRFALATSADLAGHPAETSGGSALGNRRRLVVPLAVGAMQVFVFVFAATAGNTGVAGRWYLPKAAKG